MKQRIRLSESQLHRIIKESVRRLLKEEDGQRSVFTIDAYDIDDEQGLDDMQYCSQTYYSEEEAIEAARECAESYADYDNVIIVTVYSGEYEDGRGNTLGEPYDIYSISNKDEQTTRISRRNSGYVSDTVDEYIQ